MKMQVIPICTLVQVTIFSILTIIAYPYALYADQVTYQDMVSNALDKGYEGDKQASINDLKKILVSYPNKIELYLLIAFLIESESISPNGAIVNIHGIEEAFSYLEMAYKLNPDMLEVKVYYGIYLSYLMRCNEAKNIMNPILDDSFNEEWNAERKNLMLEVFTQYTQCLLHLESYNMLDKQIQRMIEKTGEDPIVIANYIDYLAKIKSNDFAIEIAQKYSNKNYSYIIEYKICELFYKSGDIDKSKQCYMDLIRNKNITKKEKKHVQYFLDEKILTTK